MKEKEQKIPFICSIHHNKPVPELCDSCNVIFITEKYAKEYADWKIKECLPKKMPGYFDVNDYEEGCTTGFNRCIDQILSNKDKK